MSLGEVHSFIEEVKLFDIQLINLSDSAELFVRFAFNTLVLFMLIKVLYARHSNRKDFFFSYFAIGITVFLLCFLLESVKLELGFALGLFAVFGIIRYRTDAIPIKEMTYLFVVIGVSVINALANKKISYTELLVTNLAIVAGLYALEKVLRLKQENSKEIVYEKIGNIHVDKEAELMEDLKARTGISIKRFEVKKIDFLRDTAKITIYYDANGHLQTK
ncbi:MAG TPA: DUF4956 domain-containing protein [Marinilabiliales bacterium]|jgi:hypothetical protein|nr:MAG: hypothetical protein A2W84_12245 [Bacteroidetes bacterium GWC2_40_13]OFX73791.1 MAG: hypothetical protein A2W96_07940 [Bacteroidetes bacterium GWD2_40_43]OFX89419.1 MAG: hypothetical protein A2W97_13760 [Bacteroidetes bacterium GWE2_40_63]OFZ28146.1 MAG: hypothetical protein A2437_04575 [Bacteroidetes bacterium RIFOXYC2_FULL_40_12]HAM97495.1 DUF4956 domain-containing protein [Marinilabiliales bacterium]